MNQNWDFTIGHSIFAIILSAIAIALSVFAITVNAPCSLQIGDYTLLITVLSLLVTLLVGWNIFSAIKINDRVESQRKEYDYKITNAIKQFDEKYNKNINTIAGLSYARTAELGLALKENSKLCQDFYLLNNTLKAVYILTKYDCCQEANGLIWELLHACEPQSLILTKEQIEYFKGELNKIDNLDTYKLGKFSELKSFIASLRPC